MKKFSIFLLSLLALNLSFGEEVQTAKPTEVQTKKETKPSELSELKKQKEMLAEMRDDLSAQDQAALEKDFEKKLAEIEKKIAQLEETPESSVKAS